MSRGAKGSLTFLAVALAVALAAWQMRRVGSGAPDDAWITLRYARNLAHGNGLVWNAGERVEGFTTHLWAVLVAAGIWIGGEGEFVAEYLGMTFALASILLLGCLRWLVPGTSWKTGPAGALLLGSSTLFIAWSRTMMEVTLVAFCVLAVCIAAWRCIASTSCASIRRTALATGILASIAVTARIDSGLAMIPIGLAFLLFDRPNARIRVPWLTAGFAICFVPFFVWRFGYYGWLLPNTFYAKVGSGWGQVIRGMHYSVEFFGIILALLFGCSGLLWGEHPRALKFVLLGIPLLHASYVIAVGGDWFGGYRFYAPLIPSLCLAAAAGLMTMNLSRRLGLCSLALVVASSWAVGTYHLRVLPSIKRNQVGPRGAVAHGQWMKDNLSPDTITAVNAAGAMPYHSGLPTIDMLGLNDAHIAHRPIPGLGTGTPGHEKGDGKYVLSRRPEWVIVRSFRGTYDPYYLSEKEMFATQEFKDNYVNVQYRLYNGQRAQAWVRKSYIPQLDSIHPIEAEKNRFIWRDQLWEGQQFIGRFDGGMDGWAVTTEYAESRPTTSIRKSGQRRVIGAVGSGMINTWDEGLGDQPTTALRSPQFTPTEGDALFFLVGGGRGKDVGVSLFAEGARVESRRGSNSETLRLEAMNLSLYAGKVCRIEVFDRDSAGWGHVLADQFVLARATGPEPLPHHTKDDTQIAAPQLSPKEPKHGGAEKGELVSLPISDADEVADKAEEILRNWSRGIAGDDNSN